MVEVEFKECVRVGGTVYNGPTETKHADGSVTRYPGDRAGLSEDVAEVIVKRNLGRIVRAKEIPETVGTGKDPWMDGRQLGLSELIARVMKLEEENTQLKDRLGKRN
jgi:hypothetical protein